MDFVVGGGEDKVVTICRARDFTTVCAVADGLGLWLSVVLCGREDCLEVTYDSLRLATQFNFNVFAETTSSIHDCGLQF